MHFCFESERMTEANNNANFMPEWQIKKTHPDLIEDLEIGLSGVTDPELGFSVVELGLVRDISINDNQAHAIMILTTPFCPYGPALMEQTRAQIEKTLAMPTTIEYSPMPWDPTLMDPELRSDDWGFFS